MFKILTIFSLLVFFFAATQLKSTPMGQRFPTTDCRHADALQRLDADDSTESLSSEELADFITTNDLPTSPTAVADQGKTFFYCYPPHNESWDQTVLERWANAIVGIEKKDQKWILKKKMEDLQDPNETYVTLEEISAKENTLFQDKKEKTSRLVSGVLLSATFSSSQQQTFIIQECAQILQIGKMLFPMAIFKTPQISADV